jgi:hypothetical protein
LPKTVTAATWSATLARRRIGVVEFQASALLRHVFAMKAELIAAVYNWMIFYNLSPATVMGPA